MLVSYSADESPPTVRIWNTTVSGFLSSIVGVQGKCIKVYSLAMTSISKQHLLLQQQQQQQQSHGDGAYGGGGGSSASSSHSSNIPSAHLQVVRLVWDETVPAKWVHLRREDNTLTKITL